MMGYMLVGTMSYKLAESYGMDKLSTMVLGLVAFVVITPTSMKTNAGETIGKNLSLTWLGT